MRKVSALCVVLLLQNSFAWLTTSAALADPVNLDLSSTTHSVPASALGGSGTTAIRTPNGVSVVHSGQMLTPAQFAAAQQVLATGRQTLDLGTNGNAVGGRFNTGITTQLSALVVPTNVTMLQNFANGAVNVNGSVINSGNIFAYSNNDGVRNAIMNATSIQNLPQGLISSIVPQSVLNSAGITHTVPNLALTLNATNSIQNQGQITAGGAVNLNTPDVNNSGLISSANNSVNFTSTDNIHVDNTKGTISAPNGAINFRTPDFADKKDLNLTGGTLSAQQVNFNSGDGHIKVEADNILGRINIDGGTSVVTAHGGNLDVGNVRLTGDPAFYNTLGDVSLNGTISASGQDIAIIASRNVKEGGAFSIDTSSASGDGGDVTIIAGANFTSDGGSSGSGDTTSTLTITSPSASGGTVIFASDSSINTSTTASGGVAGDVKMYAFQGIHSDFGQVSAFLPIDVSAPSGTAGGITAIGPSGVFLTSISANSSTTGGPIILESGQPVITGNVQFINGTLQSGGTIAEPQIISDGRVTIQGNVTAAAPLLIKAGDAITTGNIDTGSGAVTVIDSGTNMTARLATILANGVDIQTQAERSSWSSRLTRCPVSRLVRQICRRNLLTSPVARFHFIPWHLR